MPKRSGANRNDIHITPREDGWAVKREGSERASSIHRTQREAIDAGRALRGPSKGELLTHGKDGKIRARDSAPGGSDPHPPKG